MPLHDWRIDPREHLRHETRRGRRHAYPGLAARGVDTVLIAGTVTNVCCESSARDAATLGHRVVMVADANAAGSDDQHNATLHTFYRSFGDVRGTADVLAMIAAGAGAGADAGAVRGPGAVG